MELCTFTIMGYSGCKAIISIIMGVLLWLLAVLIIIGILTGLEFVCSYIYHRYFK